MRTPVILPSKTPAQDEISRVMSYLGRMTSVAKATAARTNGKLGGRKPLKKRKRVRSKRRKAAA